MGATRLLVLLVYLLLTLSLGACTAIGTDAMPLPSIAATTAEAAMRATVQTLPAAQASSAPAGSAMPSPTTIFVPLITSTPSSVDIPTDLSDLEIYMEKTACEGPCPVYSVSVQGDGTVLYNGKTCVNVVGEQSDQISEDQVRDLVEAFYRYDFFSLEDAYVEDVQDIPAILIRFSLQDQTKQVVKQVYDESKAPVTLKQLEDTIDTIANTQQWVTANGTPVPCP